VKSIINDIALNSVKIQPSRQKEPIAIVKGMLANIQERAWSIRNQVDISPRMSR
jgi:hypothetical protein